MTLAINIFNIAAAALYFFTIANLYAYGFVCWSTWFEARCRLI